MYTIKIRRDLASRWRKINPVLAEGEPGFETDTGKMKIGDGISKWSGLPYFVPTDPDAPLSFELAEHIADDTPHPVYDDGPSLFLLYENAKV